MPPCFVPLRPGSGPGAVYLIGGLGGDVDGLIELGRSIDVPCPVYGIEARGLKGECEPDTTVEAMAAYYLDAIRAIQPRGPYLLVGHSAGGLVTFEISKRLLQTGERPALHVMVDAGIHPVHWSRAYWWRYMFGRAWVHFWTCVRLGPKAMAAYVADKLRALLGQLSERGGARINRNNWRDHHEDPAVRKVMEAGRLAVSAYCPDFYDGKVTYIGAGLPGPRTVDPRALWLTRIADLEIRTSPGGHESMLEHPHVDVLAETIASLARPSLEAARRGES